MVDVSMSETARRAHYVLPAASQFEKWETVVFTPHFPDNVLKVRPPLFDLPAGCRTEQQIHTELLRRLGRLPTEEVLDDLRAVALTSRQTFMERLFGLIVENPQFLAVAPAILAETLGPALGDDPRLAATSVLWFLCHQLVGSDPTAVRRAGFDGEPAEMAEALFERLLTAPEGVVFARHEVDEMWNWIAHPDGRVHVAIDELLDELASLDTTPPVDDGTLVLAAGQRRRWNANAIIKSGAWRGDPDSGALTMHPGDLARLGITDGAVVDVRSASGVLRPASWRRTASTPATARCRTASASRPTTRSRRRPTNSPTRRTAATSPRRRTTSTSASRWRPPTSDDGGLRLRPRRARASRWSTIARPRATASVSIPNWWAQFVTRNTPRISKASCRLSTCRPMEPFC